MGGDGCGVKRVLSTFEFWASEGRDVIKLHRTVGLMRSLVLRPPFGFCSCVSGRVYVGRF